MVASHPYSLWPLHVKLFSATAVSNWKSACKELVSTLPLPPGCTESVELEGVDGKAGYDDAARSGPIDVKDQQWTEQHLKKYRTSLSNGNATRCTICKGEIQREELTAVRPFNIIETQPS